MIKHSDIQNNLYDYAMNVLDDNTRQTVEQHLATCRSCTEDLSVLQQAIELLPTPLVEPGDEKDETFWNALTSNIEREIRLNAQPKPSFLEKILDNTKQLFALRPAYAYAISGSLATLIIAVILFQLQPREDVHVATVQPNHNDSTVWLANYNKSQERISQYFRRSRTLLVGIANMKDNSTTDLRAERQASRDLIHEARFIRQQPINNKTEKLVHDLERILIELANTEEQTDLPNVELIRSGIQQENLLFKIRMAEASFDTSRSVTKDKLY
jgi:hypothetical protein